MKNTLKKILVLLVMSLSAVGCADKSGVTELKYPEEIPAEEIYSDITIPEQPNFILFDRIENPWITVESDGRFWIVTQLTEAPKDNSKNAVFGPTSFTSENTKEENV